MYTVEDEVTYPRAVDVDGVVHHNVASYDYEPIIDREIAAFRAFMQHIKQVDSQTHTIHMIQVKNEIAVFGVDRKNRRMWRDHSPAANDASRIMAAPEAIHVGNGVHTALSPSANEFAVTRFCRR